MSLRVGVVGATGYSGETLIRILARHSKVKIAAAMSRSITQPMPIGKRFPALSGQVDVDLVPLDEERLIKDCELIFLALPHTQSMERVTRFMKEGKRVIDLAGDFRLKDPALYQKWYGKKHVSEEALKSAVYGLTEVNRDAIREAKIIANPGCYATSVILAAAPLVKGGYLADGELIADSKSGITGAGREAKQDFHFPEMEGNAWAYRVNRHPHQPEMSQVLSGLGNGPVRILFTPQVIPVARGILTTVYARLAKRVTQEELSQAYGRFYDKEHFVRVREAGTWPQLKDVVQTNYCDVSITVSEEGDRVTLISALDNLVKGASGQAVQNMNVMFGWRETEGLL